MLDTDIVGLRRLFEARPREYYYAWARVMPDNDVLLPPFTGKVVKSLLIRANPVVEEVFSGRYTPKPIHLSTLVRVEDGRLYYMWKKHGSEEASMRLGMGQEALFFLGFTEDIAHQVLDALANLDGVELFNVKWRLIEYGVESYRLPTDSVPRKYSLEGVEAVKIEFRTPTLLLDPYKKSRYRRFLPVPGIVFSYNIGDLLRMERGRDYLETVNLVNALLNETYSVLDTAKSIMYIYEGKKLPGLAGYVKYMIDWDMVKKTNARLLLENLLMHASIMGVGTSRANGFGHVTIKYIEAIE